MKRPRCQVVLTTCVDGPVFAASAGTAATPRSLASGEVVSGETIAWSRALPARYPAAVRRAGVIVGCLVATCLIAPFASAAPTPMVDLGAASTYAALSGASVGNTVNAAGAPHTTLRGNLGVAVNTQPTGFPPGVVTGATNVGNAAATQAQSDIVTAYAEVAGRTGGTPLAGALAGTTILPGLYSIAGAVSNTTTVTLDGGGDRNAIFVFQINGAMAVAAGSQVVLTGGARASRVFWQVNGAGAVGANASFAGTLMAHDAVAIGNGSLVNGRAFALNGALTLDANDVYSAPPALAIAGGASVSTTATTPTISGTTDLAAPGLVTVTVNGQTLSATPSNGAWSVTPTILANGTYSVVASVTDGAGNPGSAVQQLTIDTVPPLITLTGGSSVRTNSSTPTIAGTTDVAQGTIVSVVVGGATLTALVQASGAWNVRAAPLSDGTRAVTASVSDPAGNVSSASSSLTIDTLAPAATITGGASALSNDATPTISGTAAVAAGTTVSVMLADETLLGLVQGDGSWSVPAAALADGSHRVIMSVSDAAGNATILVQLLTIDTVPPNVSIAGGAVATASNLDPTLVGTSDAAPGTIVTLSIAGQTITTLLQGDGSWNATPTTVGEGVWHVVASVRDPAGNIGKAEQTLTSVASSPSPATGSEPAPRALPPGPPTPVGGSLDAVTDTTVSRNSSQRITRSVRSIGTTVKAPASGGVVVSARGTVRIRGVRNRIALTTRRAACAAGNRVTLRLTARGSRMSASRAWSVISSAVKAHRTVAATITVVIADAAGNRRTLTRTVALT